MASMNMDKQLDEQPPAKKQRIDNPEEKGEIANSNEAGLPKSPEMMGHKDLPIRRPLPLELNCEIFKCLKLPVQCKFIWGLGRGIYAMFGKKLLNKTKRVRNPAGNFWNGTNTRAIVAADGLHVSKGFGRPSVFAVQPFPLSGPQCRMDEFPGTICYYFEVKGHREFNVGLSDGAIPDHSWIGYYPNSYAVPTGLYLDTCWLAGEPHHFELPEETIQQRQKRHGINVYGCGLVLDQEDKLWIFFTFNGILMGRKIPISPTVDRLFPAVRLDTYTIKANFGNNPAKPFEYDIQNCPGLGLACI